MAWPGPQSPRTRLVPAELSAVGTVTHRRDHVWLINSMETHQILSQSNNISKDFYVAELFKIFIYWFTRICRSIIHNSQKVKAIQMSIKVL